MGIPFYLNHTKITGNQFLINRTDGNNSHTIRMFQKSLMLSVLPRYINTFKEDSFKLWRNRERSNTSNVPEPLSRKN